MSVNKRKFSQLIGLLLLIICLSGCKSNEQAMKYYYFLSLNGESPTWEITGYEVVITLHDLKAGNGILKMKKVNEYLTRSFQYESHAIINGKDMVVHAGSKSGETDSGDIAKQEIGSIEGGAFLNKKGKPITLKDIREIYMIVEWWDADKKANVQERIDLYSKDGKENSFLK